MTDNTSDKILEYLKECYRQNINMTITSSQIAEHFGDRNLTTRSLLRHLKLDGYILQVDNVLTPYQ